ncbi:hypothetical protein J6590_039497 [Homalodisca vitripennis]|nr:hypothetical protein J6590_039497 [Homalodisca vitripennis]
MHLRQTCPRYHCLTRHYIFLIPVVIDSQDGTKIVSFNDSLVTVHKSTVCVIVCYVRRCVTRGHDSQSSMRNRSMTVRIVAIGDSRDRTPVGFLHSGYGPGRSCTLLIVFSVHASAQYGLGFRSGWTCAVALILKMKNSRGIQYPEKKIQSSFVAVEQSIRYCTGVTISGYDIGTQEDDSVQFDFRFLSQSETATFGGSPSFRLAPLEQLSFGRRERDAFWRGRLVGLS